MIKTIALAVIVALGALLIFAASRPDTFRVQRTATIKAPPDKLHPLINDMRVFNTWNPYNLKDPNVQGEYQGPQAGPGAVYRFAGNKDVGKGSIAIVDTAGDLVYFEKMDDTQVGSVQIAQAKARSAARFKRATKVFQDGLAAGGVGLRLLALEGAVPVEGGIPLVSGGKIVGAIGASGGTSEQDGVVAQAGASALK